MQVRKGKPLGSDRLARTGAELSREARIRLAWMDFDRDSGNVARTCRHFGISRQTFCRWQRRYDPYDLTSLEWRSHCPHNRRQPTWSFLLEENATASAATEFLDTLQIRMPFPIRALQVDGGSEFAAEFEQACQQRGLHLFVLPPRSPKLDGAVERANCTHTEEFYQVTPCSLEMKKLNRELRQWEKIYNTVRPHQSLGYLTPRQFLLQNSSQRKE